MRLDWLKDLPATPGPSPGRRVLSSRATVYEDRTPAERGEAIVGLAAMVGAVLAELFDLVAASDAARDHHHDGAVDMASWLVAMCNISRSTADEWVRVADRLQSLPAVRGAFASGELSWEQVRAATWFVTPETDWDAAGDLPGLSAAQLFRLSRQCRPRTADDATEAQSKRRLAIRADHKAGGYRYSGFLPTREGAAVNAKLAAAAETAGVNPLTGRWDPAAVRLADALVDTVTGARSGGDTDSAVVVLHADAADLDEHLRRPVAGCAVPDLDGRAGAVRPGADRCPPAPALPRPPASGTATLGDLTVCTDSVLAALCDCTVEVAVHGADGATLGVGRSARRPPPWLRRHVRHRDQHCRFRGCERPIRQIHHICHWTADGPTDAGNLVGLCWHHHHLVHEGRWSIHGHPDRVLVFVSPTGRRITSRPQPLAPSVRRVVDDALDRPPPGSTPDG